ncbi:MAG: methyltransferase [Chitinophagales bacterium]|nr:methyltransferase [Chitinophagales bacterium]
MSNSFFQFKQFRIDQDRSAMKVTTDACILGASIPVPVYGKILDVGTGTGLLSLILAQRTQCDIEGVEIDEQSYKQATENCQNSPWKERLKILNEDFKKYNPPYKFDLVITNPPFYENQFRSPNPAVNVARHNDRLPFKELLDHSKELLKPGTGLLAILLPGNVAEKFTWMAKAIHLYQQLSIVIKDKPTSFFFREIAVYSFEVPKKIVEEVITIKGNDNRFTLQFQHLMRPFYLHL